MRASEAVLMHRDGPVTQLPIGAAPGKWPGLRACLMFMLGVGMFCVPVLAAPAPGDKPATAKVKDVSPADYVGGETCATCHDEVAKGFATNPHTNLAKLHGNNGATCESCHGAGRLHVEGGGDITKIFNPSKATAKEVDANCLGCHQGKHQNFDRSAHGEGNVSCISCHSIHASGSNESLLKAPQPTLCFQCHTDIKPQFSMPFHHKVNEGLIQCTDCHDAHGTYGKKAVMSSTQQDLVCTKCHTETGGPFVYEHAVVKTEGCTACHTPHGGPNPRLLNRGNVNTICLQCHSPSMNFTTHTPTGPSHNQAAQYQACTICHTAIHGSNVSNVFFNPE
ncbi:MAG: DmsE family decaheme c-type cytochrome [Terracidiphilus sp.]